MKRSLAAGVCCVGLVLSAGVLVTSCGSPDGGNKTPTIKRPERTPDATYTTRGEVKTLPKADDRKSAFRVHHEAIDDFKNKAGEVVGMNAMTMDFPPADGVDLSDLKVGDKVSITFSVWWGNTPGWLAVTVEKLPAETKLEFRNARPAGKEPEKPAEEKK